MDESTVNLIFLSALLEHLDRLKTLLGENWRPFRSRLLRLLKRISDSDEDEISLLVDEILEQNGNTRAAPLLRALFQQARQANRPDGDYFRLLMRDPTADKARPVKIFLSGLLNRKPTASIDDIQGVTRVLRRALGDTSPDVSYEALMVDEPDEAESVTTHPLLQGKNHALLARPYRLTVKLSDQPQPEEGAHLSTPEFDVPVDPGQSVVKLRVKLSAPDFDLAPAEASAGWLREMNFYPEAAASSAITFTLLAQDRFEERYFAGLRVQFILDGQVLGSAFRRVEVLRDENVSPTPANAFPPAPGYPLDEKGIARIAPVLTPLSYRPDAPLVDLTVSIFETETEDKLLWEIAGPWLEPADFPPGDYFSQNLGAQEFVKTYLSPFGMPGNWPEDLMNTDGLLKPLSVSMLFSNLLTLRNSAPKQFWQLYALSLERYRQQGRAPEAFSILFITADTHIPWELMPVAEEIRPDETEFAQMPLLLGSAHRVGRWLLETGNAQPEARLDLRGFTLAAPVYQDDPLPSAQQEADFLQRAYRARRLPNSADDFIRFMKTGRPTDGTGILHFAGHGDCCTDAQRRNWLVLENPRTLYDLNSAANNLGNRLGKLNPILAFFNACNVGRAAPGPLGSNGGWGRALLHQQYKGYIGPLWSVFDAHARDISQRFYALAIEDHLPLGEVMRQIRMTFSRDNRLFTYLAYLYLGHPLARIDYTPFE